MGTIAGKLEYLNGTKDAIKTAIESKGVSVPDGTTFRGYAALIASMPSGGIYQEKTATPTGEQFDVLPDAGYDALSKVTVAGDPNLQPWNIPEGITIYGKTGTLKIGVTPGGTDWPFPDADDTDPYAPPSEDAMDEAVQEDDADAPIEDKMVLVDNNGNITVGYMYGDDFEITYYDPVTTEFKAIGWRRVSKHTTGELAGTITRDNFISEESGGWNYLKNIRSCTREKLYYHGVEIWPNNAYMETRYLTFSSPNPFTITQGRKLASWNGKIEYSTDRNIWTVWDGQTISATTNGAAYNLYFRGTGNTTIVGADDSARKWVIEGTDVKCFGNIMCLLDYKTVMAGQQPSMGDWCFAYLFIGNKSLTQAPALPATMLSAYCYKQMFQQCTNLTQAPALPATTLAVECYYGMFYYCLNLRKAPALPATTLSVYCYKYMFQQCTNLTQAPALPATTLAVECYYGMFYYCLNLRKAPVLPATNLASACYSSMFYWCQSLTQAPALPATTLCAQCYMKMFEGCTNLTQISALPATTLESECYNQMFDGCTSLTQIPALPATVMASLCYFRMVGGCKKIKLSATMEGEYTQPYRIPASGTGTDVAINSYSRLAMFDETGGTFTESPELNTTYYLSSSNTIV